MKTYAIALTVLSAAAAAVGQVTITQWDFNGTSATTVPGGNLSPTPSVGSGFASLIGGTTASFASGTSNGGSSDPVTTTPNNYAWNTTTYSAQGTGSGERGVQFAVDTTGFTGISVRFDTRHSNTSSRFLRFDWSADGGTSWVLGNVFEASTGGDTWYNGRDSGLLGAGADNNANFAFRVVAIFDPASGSAYAASTSTSTYAATGTLRYDMVTVTAIPAPGALALAGIGTLVASRRRR